MRTIQNFNNAKGWAAITPDNQLCLPISQYRVCAIRAAVWYSSVRYFKNTPYALLDMNSTNKLTNYEKKKWRYERNRGWNVILVDIKTSSFI